MIHLRPLLITALFLFGSLTAVLAQYKVEPREGFTPQIGLMVDMMEELKERITESVKDLDQEQTDFLFDENANSIGAMIMHLIANEAYYRIETLEGRQWTEEESERWMEAASLGEAARQRFKGKPISHYLKLWDEERQRSLEGLKTKDDEWFSSEIDEGFNAHWVWFHVMEHTAVHMGQIDLVKSRLPEK